MKIRRRLAADGFQSRGEYQLDSGDPDTKTVLGRANTPGNRRPRRDCRRAAAFRGKLASADAAHGNYHAVRGWQPSIVVQQSNGNRTGFPAPRAKRELFASRRSQDPRELYRLHRRAVALHAPDALPAGVTPPQFDCAALLLQEFREDCEAQRKSKMLFLDSQQGVYRATLRGAFLLTWRLLFPFRAALLFRDYARDSALRHKLLYPNREANG